MIVARDTRFNRDPHFQRVMVLPWLVGQELDRLGFNRDPHFQRVMGSISPWCRI